MTVKWASLDTLELVHGRGIVGRIGPLFFCFIIGFWYFTPWVEWQSGWNEPDTTPEELRPF